VEWLDIIQGSIDLIDDILSDLDPSSRSLEIKRSKHFLQ